MDYKQVELTRQTIFKDAILSQAEAKSMEIISQAGKKHDEEVALAQSLCVECDQNTIQANLTRDTERVLSEAAQSARKELLEYRAGLVEKMFAKIEARLVAFTESEEYKDWLVAKLEQHANFHSGTETPVIYLRPSDMDFADFLIQKLPGSTAAALPSIRLGGIKTGFGNILFDDTLDEALAQQRENFYASGRMRL